MTSAGLVGSTDGTAQIGVTGLAVMGSNIARNFARHGYTVALHNRSVAKTDALLAEHGADGNFMCAGDHGRVRRGAGEAAPRADHGQAGDPTDAVIEELAAVFEPGDIIIDGGTPCTPTPSGARRPCGSAACTSSAPVSPAARRARSTGRRSCRAAPPSPTRRWVRCSEEISAHVDGVPCCTHIGPDGAGPSS